MRQSFFVSLSLGLLLLNQTLSAHAIDTSIQNGNIASLPYVAQQSPLSYFREVEEAATSAHEIVSGIKRDDPSTYACEKLDRAIRKLQQYVKTLRLLLEYFELENVFISLESRDFGDLPTSYISNEFEMELEQNERRTQGALNALANANAALNAAERSYSAFCFDYEKPDSP